MVSCASSLASVTLAVVCLVVLVSESRSFEIPDDDKTDCRDRNWFTFCDTCLKKFNLDITRGMDCCKNFGGIRPYCKLMTGLEYPPPYEEEA